MTIPVCLYAVATTCTFLDGGFGRIDKVVASSEQEAIQAVRDHFFFPFEVEQSAWILAQAEDNMEQS
jgi:hypothetical protein